MNTSIDKLPKERPIVGSSHSILRNGEALLPRIEIDGVNHSTGARNVDGGVILPDFLRHRFETPRIDNLMPGTIYVARNNVMIMHAETSSIWVSGNMEVENCVPSTWTEDSLRNRILIQKIQTITGSYQDGSDSSMTTNVSEPQYIVDLRYAGEEPYGVHSWSDDGEHRFEEYQRWYNIMPVHGVILPGENNEAPIYVGDNNLSMVALAMAQETDGTILGNYEHNPA